LQNFSPSEKEGVAKIMPNVLDSLLEWIKENNFERMMSRFNSCRD
jgi:peptidyl-tRNA hydrolase